MEAGERCVVCPNCGAPYRSVVPVGGSQVKCGYCGATVLLKPGAAEQLDLKRAPEAPEQGLCNDCQGTFPMTELFSYEVPGSDTYDHRLEVTLCENCYASRMNQKAYGYMALGLFLLFFSIVLALSSEPFFILALGIGACALAYGIMKKREALTELS